MNKKLRSFVMVMMLSIFLILSLCQTAFAAPMWTWNGTSTPWWNTAARTFTAQPGKQYLVSATGYLDGSISDTMFVIWENSSYTPIIYSPHLGYPNTDYILTSPAGTAYGYLDKGGDASPATFTIKGIVISTPAPSFSSATNSSITWTWPAVTDAQGYKIYDAGGALLASVGSGTTSYTRTSLSAATQYGIKVTAYDYDYTTTASAISYAYTLPLTPSAPTGSTGGVSWSNNANNPGRSYAVLNWGSVTGATGYRIYMFDGYAYRMVQDVGNTTTWDSRVAKVFPSEASLDALVDNSSTSNLFVTPTTGNNLPDSPWKLYEKTSGITYDSSTNYFFKVSAYNTSGETPQSNAYTPTLPTRTDTVAPTGTLVANEGAYNTTIKDVSLAITGTDVLSGPAQISLSNDNVSWSAWETYATSKTWQVAVGQGTKTIYLKVKDAAGNVSNLISTTIFLKDDVTSPTISISIDNGAATTDKTSVSLTLSAVDDGTTPDMLVQRFSNDGTSWSSWETVSFTKAWTLAAGADGQRVVYYQVKDAVGNIQTAGDNITISTAASEPETDPPTALMSAGTVTINGVSYQIANSSQVSLRVNSPQNVAKARYSFDGISFSPWEVINVLSDGVGSYFNKDLTFAPGDGYRAIYMQFANAYAKESNITVNRYILDQTAPDFVISTLDGRTATNTSSVDLLITPKDNISTTYEYSVNGGLKQVLPGTNVVTVTGLTKGKLNLIRMKLYDTAGNFTEKTFNIFYL